MTATSAGAGTQRPLAPWTYSNPELFELEFDALFLRRWQFVGHVNDVPDEGSYLTADIGRTGVIVLRGKDRELRAFLNVCRHRASRLLKDRGVCRGVLQCPYHGWTYRLDGTLMAIPLQDNFDSVDLATLGLHPVQLEIFHGLLFVRIKGEGPGVAEQFEQSGKYFEYFDVANYSTIASTVTEVWDINWKIIWDNYLENYHIPIAHPGLHRLLKETDETEELDGGVSVGVFVLREKLSSVEQERQYQQQFHHASHRVPDAVKGKWVQIGYSPNLGIDLYPEMLDFFQLMPLGPQQTAVRGLFYGHSNPTDKERELRALNMSINKLVNKEDQDICSRVQAGIRTHGYVPGPLSSEESSIVRFHQLIRTLVPVAALTSAPVVGRVAARNQALID